MAEILDIADFPLASARARHHDAMTITPGGMLLDRILVAFELDAKAGGWKRVGQKKYPKLAQFGVEFDGHTRTPGFNITHGDEYEWLSLVGEEDYNPQPDTTISEFKVDVPVIRRSTHISRWICHHLGIPDDQLYLGQKPLWWQRGDDRDMSTAKLAPLHIVTAQSLEHAKALIDKDKVSADKRRAVGSERLRANLVLDVPEGDPLMEQMIREIIIGNLRLIKARDTERCNIPGIDQRTGQKMLDLPLAFKHLPTSNDGKPVLGAYFYPWLERGEEVTIAKDDRVKLIFD